MMRHATWKELERDVLVKVIQTVFTKIGVKLTHARLAQIVPVLGGVMSAGLSYDMLHRALGDSTRIYRARYLADKHDLSFDEWAEQAEETDAAESRLDDVGTEEFVDVSEVLQKVIEEARRPAREQRAN
jgi:hypothetical protein